MRRLLLIFCLLPTLLFGQTQVMAPFFTVFGTLKADSLAARALSITGSVTATGTIKADSLATRALTATGTATANSVAVKTLP